MAIYSVGRKRVILALLLTTALLLTLDLRGNPIIDGVRNGFSYAMEPVESATNVVTNPIERVWHGITNYDDLEQENLALQEQVDRLIGTQAAAEAAVIEGKELQALYSLPSLSGIDTEVARVVGYAANNLDQVIEIDKGSRSGIEVGMPVVNQAGLVGKVTQVSANSARVMLVTDARYSIAVKVTSSDQALTDTPTDTTPSGLDPQQVADAATTTTTTTTTVPAALVPGVTGPDGSAVPATTLPGATAPGPFVDATGRPLTEAEIRALDEAFNTPDSVPGLGPGIRCRPAGHRNRHDDDHHDGADHREGIRGAGRTRSTPAAADPLPAGHAVARRTSGRRSRRDGRWVREPGAPGHPGRPRPQPCQPAGFRRTAARRGVERRSRPAQLRSCGAVQAAVRSRPVTGDQRRARPRAR